MKVELAFDIDKTRGITFQDEFPKTTKCCQCSGKAMLAFVAHEYNEKPTKKGGKYVCDLYKTTGKKGGLWVHDAMVCAVYLCLDCLEPTALYNQA